jgi:two-component system sensor histidine kinase RstB
VIDWPFGRDRRFMLRSYLLLAGGLMIAAITLDFAFGQLQSRQPRAVDAWVAATFRAVESALLKSAPADRPTVAQELTQQLGIGIQILESNDINATPSEPMAADDSPQALVDSANNSFYLKRSTALHAAIRLGPVAEQAHGDLSRFLPVLFYLSILLVVGLWLRPLLSDIRVLTAASQKFAADYREPLATAHLTTQLTSLARNLDEMSARLSSLIQSQKELTAALSHEMRTPLARIQFALAVIGNQASDSVQTQLAGISNDVQQIDGLIASMLDYARLDHPDLRLDWQETALEPWFRHAMSAADAATHEIQLSGLDQLSDAWMEPRLMELALSNLVVNACRHARRRIAVTVAARGDRYSIVVEDDGEGIPADQRKHVFKAYTRLDSSRNRDSGGYGLGLAIVARVAALHGGNATAAASETLGGAKFTLVWPRHLHSAGRR